MTQSSYHTLGRTPQQIIKDGSFSTKKQFIQNELFHHHIVEHNIIIQGLIKKLHALLIHEKIPDFYGYFFMGQLTLCSEERLSDNLTREIQQLKIKQSHFHLIMKSIGFRETCLKSINACIEALAEDLKQPLVDRLTEQIKHLRQLTIWAIQPIQKWKESLLFISQNVFQDEHISFFYRNQDYLLKILKDTDFISKSFLSEKVRFSYKQDPFLMRPFTEEQTGNEFANIFKFEPEDQTKYIACLQYLADERADYLKRKIALKAGKIKEIERVYQANQLNQKILITKINPLSLRKVKPSVNQNPIDFIEENPKQQSKRSNRSNSISQVRQNKNKDLLARGEKIRKIKEMDLASSSPLINIKIFNSSNAQGLQGRSLSLGLIKKISSRSDKQEKQKEIQSDFQSLLRKKELQILENDYAKRRTLSSIRLKDRISERKLVDNKEGAEQLRKILDQIEHSSPQKQDSFFIRKDNSARLGKTLIQQNQQIVVNLREKILKEISDDSAAKQKVEQQKIEENKYLDKLIKTKLDQQTLKDIQKEKAKWTEGKNVLASDMNKKELFGIQESPKKSEKLMELEQELKRQMQLKFLREVHEELTHRQAISKHQLQKKKEEKERQKHLQIALRKKGQEERFQQIEKEERNKMIQKNIADEESRKKQIEKELQVVIQREQQRLIHYSNEQKMKLQSQLRESMKQKLLTSLKKEKSVMISKREAEQKQKLMEQQHREQLRKKMEEEFQIANNLQRQRDRQQKNKKLRLISQKMDHLQQQMKQSNLIRQESRKQQKIDELKSSIKLFPVASAKGQEENKRKLRQQFQLELFAFTRPENFKIQQDNFIIKDFRSQLDNEQNLNKKFSQLSDENPPQEEQASKLLQLSRKSKDFSRKAFKDQPSELTQQFVRFSEEENDEKAPKVEEKQLNEDQLKKMGINMTPEQYTIYQKKKGVLSSKRINPPQMKESEVKKIKNILDDFEKMSNLDQQKPQTANMQVENNNVMPITVKIDRTESQQIKQPAEISPKKSSKKHRQQDSQDLSDVMKLTVHSRMGSIHKKKFVTSDEEDEKQPKASKNKNVNSNVNKKKKKQIESNDQIEKQFEKPVLKVQNAIFRTVIYQNLDNYLTNHFKKLSKLMRKINLLKKDELLKSFDEYKSVMIIQVVKQQEIEGIVFAVENENKQNIRSLNMIHLGAYKAQDTINVMIKARDLLFAKDPCAEITFSMYYNKEDEEQSIFIKQFEKQFDLYGAIFQKKISNQQTQRKHILRRMIGQDSVTVSKSKAIGQLRVSQNMLTYSLENSLGIDLHLQKTGKQVGGWTILSLFLSNYGKEQQIVGQLTSDVSQQDKNMKHLSKMVMKLKNGRFPDVEYEIYQSPFQVNLRLIQLNQPLIKCNPKNQEDPIQFILTKNSIILNPTLSFASASASFHYKNVQKIGNFLRFKCGKGTKVIKLKSSLYSSVITTLPCKPANYKILLMDAMEYDNICSTTSLDLYVKLFLANITSHAQSAEEYIWIPQTSSATLKNVQYCQQFGFNNELRTKMELCYTEYVRNCVNYTPTHRDLFITPPYIIAVLNSDVEKTTEGSPIYIERVDYQNLIGAEDAPLPQPESDF